MVIIHRYQHVLSQKQITQDTSSEVECNVIGSDWDDTIWKEADVILVVHEFSRFFQSIFSDVSIWCTLPFPISPIAEMK